MQDTEMAKCTSCQQEGHKCNQKICPNFETYKKKEKPAKKLGEDVITEDWLKRRFQSVRCYTQESIELSQEVGGRCRLANIPEDVTENIVKFIIRNKLGDKSCVWCKSVGLPGDLHSDIENMQEVKSFTSDGPCSFGPTKKFDVLYFLDLRTWLQDKIVLFKVSLSHESPVWKSLKMNKKETFDEQAGAGRRPHISWEHIYPQVQDSCVKVYDGSFEGIFTQPEDAIDVEQ